MSKLKTESVILSRTKGAETREILKTLDSELLVSPRKEIGQLCFLNSIHNAAKNDVFLVPGHFSHFHRRKINFIHSRLLAVEFDDLQKPITSLEQTDERAEFDTARASDFMNLLCGDFF